MSSISTFATNPTLNPAEALFSTIDEVHDHSVLERDSWMYGIIVGWPEQKLKHLATLHRWNDEQVGRLKILHAAFTTAYAGTYLENPVVSHLRSQLNEYEALVKKIQAIVEKHGDYRDYRFSDFDVLDQGVLRAINRQLLRADAAEGKLKRIREQLTLLQDPQIVPSTNNILY